MNSALDTHVKAAEKRRWEDVSAYPLGVAAWQVKAAEPSHLDLLAFTSGKDQLAAALINRVTVSLKLIWLAALFSGLAAAHGTEAHAGGVQVWLVLGLIVPPVLYALGLTRLWRRAGLGRGVPVWRAVTFFGGMTVLALALTALDALADESFAWHMFQHLLLITVAAPLLVVGSPLYVSAWALPLAWRRGLARSWHAAPLLRSLGAALSHPVSVWVIATAVFWLWHVPRFYEAAVADERLHAVEHFTFLVTSAAFWWAVLVPQGRRALGRGAGVVYLFAAALQGSLLGVLLVFARAPLYPGYARTALAENRDPLSDQQLAGLVMWVPSGVIYVALAAVFFVQWLREEEREQRRREAVRRVAAPQGGGQ